MCGEMWTPDGQSGVGAYHKTESGVGEGFGAVEMMFESIELCTVGFGRIHDCSMMQLFHRYIRGSGER